MNQKNLIIIGIILIIAVAVIFYLVGYSTGQKSMESTIAKYKKIIDYHLPVAEEIFSISGKITEIQSKELNIETTVPDPYKLPEEQKPEIRKVIITDDTEITKFDMNTGENIEISFSDLKTGDQIYVMANENIKDKAEFEAKSINLESVPEALEL